MSSKYSWLSRSVACAALTTIWALACSPTASNLGVGDGDGDDSLHPGGDGDGGINIDDPTQAPPTSDCGDGKRDPDEACDDGNRDETVDGCAFNCRYVDDGFICPDEGEPCRPFAKCGDGKVVSPEQCDDGARANGDGCSDICQVEIGYKCEDDGSGKSVCSETVCGDGKKEGAETCDDNNTVPFDGCSAICQAEPICTNNGCTSSCGDGVLVGDEECDDGNSIDGDGCSSSCKEEEGYTCSQPQECDKVAGVCALTLPIIYRDFKDGHQDFARNCNVSTTGVAASELVNGKPVLASAADGTRACITSQATFAQWYTDNAENKQVVDQIVLFDNGKDGFVNRMDNSGKQWFYAANQQQVAASICEGAGCCAGIDPWNCCEKSDTCKPCIPNSNQGCTYDTVYQDGNPLFFPLEGNAFSSGDTTHGASIFSPYQGNTSEKFHFSFTSELTYWFQYDANKALDLEFLGDDDVFVFINGRLAVELAGIHAPIQGYVRIAKGGALTMNSNGTTKTGTAKADLGLEDGKVYEIKIFQAERNPTASSYKLTLDGFSTARSRCESFCGDGIISAGEMCDDGENNTPEGEEAHDRCSFDCQLSAYCGDGIKQAEEECDDNDPDAGSNCYGCKYLIIR